MKKKEIIVLLTLLLICNTNFYLNRINNCYFHNGNIKNDSLSIDKSTDEITQNSEYLVVTPDRFTDSLTSFINWKNERGIITRFITLEEIEITSYGNDIQEKILNFLKETKNTNCNFEWLLLAGDYDIIPARQVYVNNKLVDTDLYYADLTNNWDSDYDDIYAEENFVDWHFDLQIGRIPFNEESEIENYVSRLINYEKNPLTIDNITEFFLFGGILNYDTLDTLKFDSSTSMEFIRNEIKQKEFNSIFTTIYETEGISPSTFSSNYSLNNNIVNQQLNSSNGIFFFSGHGNQEYVADYIWLNDTNDNELAEESELKQNFFLTRNMSIDQNFNISPLIYIEGCSAAYSKINNNLASHLLSNKSLSVIGSYDISYYTDLWSPTNNILNQGLSTRFFNFLISEESNYCPSKALNLAKMNYTSEYGFINEKERQNLFVYNYLGDPELSLFVENDLSEPTLVDQVVDPAKPLQHNNITFKIKIEDDSGIKNASLWFSTDNKTTWQEKILDTDVFNYYSTILDNYSEGTKIFYYFTVFDNSINENELLIDNDGEFFQLLVAYYDREPPEIIEHYMTPVTAILGEQVKVYLNITDDSGIKNAYFYYRLDSFGDSEHWNKKIMFKNEEGLYWFAFTYSDPVVLRYYLEISDNSYFGNKIILNNGSSFVVKIGEEISQSEDNKASNYVDTVFILFTLFSIVKLKQKKNKGK